MDNAQKMGLKKTLKIILWIMLGGLLLAGGYCVVLYRTIYIPETNFTIEPVSQETFTNSFGDIGLPKSAINILYARSVVSMGFAGAFLFRFDAPVPDCLAYGERLIEQNNRMADESRKVPTNLVSLAKAPASIDHDLLRAYGFANLHWFDVENIKLGVEGRGPPTGRGFFWIDTERGRFYYYWTD